MSINPEAPFNPSDHDAMRRLMEMDLVFGINEFFTTVRDRLQSARTETNKLAGQGYDAYYVRTDESKIGRTICSRLRLTPSALGDPETRVGHHPVLKYDVRQMVVEVPKLFDEDNIGVLFVSLKATDGTDVSYIISRSRVLEVDPRDEQVEVIVTKRRMILVVIDKEANSEHLVDLNGPEVVSDDELARRVTAITMLQGIATHFNLANQSRADGTAE